MNIYRKFSVLLLTSLVIFTSGLQAADGTATLVASRGEVMATFSDVKRSLTQGDPVFVQDQVTTGDTSFAILQFIDGAKVTVRPNSKLIIEQYVFNGGDEDVALLNLMEGLRIPVLRMQKAHP